MILDLPKEWLEKKIEDEGDFVIEACNPDFFKDRIIGYRFKPVYESEYLGGMQTASTISCFISRRQISGCGGPGYGTFHPSVAKLILKDKCIQDLIRTRLREYETEQVK